MQFVKGGPEVPEGLLQAHEEGTVVFFCGAGISYPAGLPGFSGLVDEIYTKVGVAPSGIEHTAINSRLYDTAIGLLEGRLAGGRMAVRRQLPTILRPDLKRPGALETHDALLTLAEGRTGLSRLVTTNFDPLFEIAMTRRERRVQTFNAPLLPVPKARWDGLVYLHGTLPENPTDSDLNRLVIASGDFGLAYLMERWASRFVSELFRNFTVCFIGYSIDDPVMRYMMDALAADRLMGETPGQSYAFGSFKGDEETRTYEEWAAKNVVPILYNEENGHALLHRTLQEWAATYRDGVSGKEAVVARYSGVEPTGSTKQDDFVGRMIWALSDRSGLPAKHFAEFEPRPPLSWLESLIENRFNDGDLSRYGIKTDEKNTGHRFGVLDRPSPYTLSPRMALVSGMNMAGSYDLVMQHLSRWVARHADNPKLIVWIANRGGSLHPVFRWSILRELDDHPLPAGSAISRLWSLILSGRVTARDIDLYDWQRRFLKEGLTMGLRLALRDALTPYVELREPLRVTDVEEEEAGTGEDPDLSALVRWDIKLAATHTHSPLRDLRENEGWHEIVRTILPDVTGLLADTMDLKRELGGADDTHDYSYVHQPSILDHEQNRDFNDWTILIELVRDGWSALADEQPALALAEVERWRGYQYPIFLRLSFFAATQRPDVVPLLTALKWVLENEGWWLWSTETQREMGLLVTCLAKTLEQAECEVLQDVILRGPPRSMFRSNIKDEEFSRLADREAFRLLNRLVAAGAKLSNQAADRLDAIKDRYPDWPEIIDDSTDFPFWMGNGDNWTAHTNTPTELDELQAWLANNPGDSRDESDDWAHRCETDFEIASAALVGLAKKGVWPSERWRQALQVWSSDDLAARSWKQVSETLLPLPHDQFVELARGIAWWLGAVGKTKLDRSENFFVLSNRVLDLFRATNIDFENDAQSKALNHPIGLTTQALLSFWYQQNLEDAQGLQQPFRDLFTGLCDPGSQGLHLGRMILSRAVITLFRVDADWTIRHLLPFFSWTESVEFAATMWQGFLQSPRMHWPLLEAIKTPFLDTALRLELLGETYQRQYVIFITIAALQSDSRYGEGEFQRAFDALRPNAYQDVAEGLLQGVSGAGDRRADFFNNRVVPFMKKHWRKSTDVRMVSVSERLARLCVAAGDAFPEAVMLLKDWMQRLDTPSFVIHVLVQSKLVERFPAATLTFLDNVISDDAKWLREEAKVCLAEITQALPNLSDDYRFQRIVLILRKSGLSWP